MVEPNRLEPCELVIATAGANAVDSWYWMIDWPDRKTALPATETAVKSVLEPLALASMSPIRPPQPFCAPSMASACQVDCWSLCEKRLAGIGADLAEYCALVIG